VLHGPRAGAAPRCPLADLCRWRAEAGGVTPRVGPDRAAGRRGTQGRIARSAA
jgi:hypothetical protein